MDNKDPGIRKISVEVSEEPPHCLDIDDCCISYDISGDGCTVQAFGGSNKYIEKVPLIGILDDLAVILKNPKLRLNLLEVSAFEEQRAILKAFGEISSMLHTKRITLEGFEPCDFISMLSYFKPGILGEINIENLSNFTDTTQVCDLFELEQWKQAKSISIISKKHFNFPIEHLFHLSRFQVNWMRLSVDDAIKIRDVSLNNSSFDNKSNNFQVIMKSSHFESGMILAEYEIEPEVVRVFDPNYNEAGNFDLVKCEIEKFLVKIYGKSLIIKKID